MGTPCRCVVPLMTYLPLRNAKRCTKAIWVLMTGTLLYSLFAFFVAGFIVPQLLKAAATPNAFRTHHIINAIIIVSHTATRTYAEDRVTLLQDHNPDP